MERLVATDPSSFFQPCSDPRENTGKHAQAPAVVAAKTHYFQELDVVASVNNILRDNRLSEEFLKSDLWIESVSDRHLNGSILEINLDFFVKELSKQASLDSKELVRQATLSHPGGEDENLGSLIISCLTDTANWASVCRRLLHYLPDGQIVDLLTNGTSDDQSPLSGLLVRSRGLSNSLDDTLTLNLLTSKHRDLRLMISSAIFSTQDKIDKITRSLHEPAHASSHWNLLQASKRALLEGKNLGGSSLDPLVVIALEAWSLMRVMGDLSSKDLTATALSCGLKAQEASREDKVFDLLESDDEGTDSKKKKRKDKKRRRREEEDGEVEEEGGVAPPSGFLWTVDGHLLNKEDLAERIVSLACDQWLK